MPLNFLVGVIDRNIKGGIAGQFAPGRNQSVPDSLYDWWMELMDTHRMLSPLVTIYPRYGEPK